MQWNVTRYTRFEASAGIDDNTTDAFGVVVELLLYYQDGRQLVAMAVAASVGHPQEISLDLTGVVSLRATCSGRNAKTNQQRSTYAALGDARIIHA
ncbi:NPCBM/NEW2 domain-containing protein [Dactylosporangium sp. NPDC049742]|uniref:NPCBM/NEW2 domain-containing protein n=1 Tax=Dactylosporangium sp. NPDC049742 TaxID=3154737 RepID=UPI00343B8746